MTRNLWRSIIKLTILGALLGGAADSAMAQARPVRGNMLVSTAWLAGQLKNPQVVVLHIARDRKSYDEGHIPGARFVAFGDIVVTRDGLPNEIPPVEDLRRLFTNLGVGDRSRIILYGDSNGLAATRTYFTLDYLGHGERAALLDGGLEKWKAEKRALETTAPTIEPAEMTPRLRPAVAVKMDAVRDISWVATNLEKSDVAIIDSRPAEQYVGTDTPRSGHIPGAANLFWMNHLVGKDDLTMKPAAELKKMYRELGLQPNQKVVTYCNSGVQATHSYFTLKYLGYDVTMYDASMTEWSKAANAPMVKGKERK